MKTIQFDFSRQLVAASVLLASMFVGSAAHAALIVCPNPLTVSQDREYRTTGASDCVWGSGNIGQGQPANDAFLLGQGTNDAMYGDSGVRFGLTWTTIDSKNFNVNTSSQPSLTGLTISNSDGDYFEWLLTDVSYATYALGLKDGGDPKWAVFLLSDISGVAEITSQGGDWSHVVLYGSGTASNGGGSSTSTGGGPSSSNGGGVPEPGSLALMGVGALVGAFAHRRRRLRVGSGR
jgi:hypothetical protein